MGLSLRRGTRLSTVQARLLESLRRDGIVVTSIAELFDDGSLWADLERDMGEFVAETERRLLTMSPADVDDAYGKPFLVRRYRPRRNDPDRRRVRLSLANPWLRVGVSSEVLDVVRGYRGESVRLVDLDSLYVIPSEDGTRAPSQGWHRDAWDDHIVKVFVFFSPLDEGTSTFEYVRSSASGGVYGDRWPWALDGVYPPEDELVEAIGEQDFVSVSGPPGTVIFCDTSGFSRSGFAANEPQVLAYYAYISDEAQQRLLCGAGRKFAVERSNGVRLPAAARYALG